jgi:hypothetical protein
LRHTCAHTFAHPCWPNTLAPTPPGGGGGGGGGAGGGGGGGAGAGPPRGPAQQVQDRMCRATALQAGATSLQAGVWVGQCADGQGEGSVEQRCVSPVACRGVVVAASGRGQSRAQPCRGLRPADRTTQRRRRRCARSTCTPPCVSQCARMHASPAFTAAPTAMQGAPWG